MNSKRIRYYNDETKDDFQITKTHFSVTIDKNYNYLPKSPFFKIFSFLFYYFIAFPILSIVSFLFCRVKIVGRKNFKKLKKLGYFIYANHTSVMDTWLAPVNLVPFRRVYVLSNKDAVQIPVVNIICKSLGALPVADTYAGFKNLNNTISHLIKSKKVIAIYPEAHIWHYYTKLRPFPVAGFKFAANTLSPCVPVCVCYKKKKINGEKRKPKAVAYVGEPIYPQKELSAKDSAQYMRDAAYNFINETLKKESTYAYYEYVKLPPKQN